LCGRLPGAEVTLVDVNPGRAAVAAALGCGFAAPEAAPGDCDLVIHASATGAGLATGLGAAGLEATVVEASWYGDRPPTVGLGGAFHSRRLRLVSSQVGLVPTGRRARWSNRRRLEAALGLLADPALDALISGETAFDALAERYGAILEASDTLCHRVFYD
jgi:threonine dehydrogenase-like Zn-dependent dehydrogenase